MKKITIIQVVILIMLTLAMTNCKSSNVKANIEPTKRILDVLTPAGIESTIVVEKENISTTKNPEEQTLLAEGVVIFVKRSGGFAGVDESWSFYADGKIVTNKGEQKTVTADQVSTLIEEINAAGFFEMNNSSGSEKFSNCKDCYTYQLIATSDGKVNSITIQEGATGVPEALLKIIKQLIGLARNL